METTPEQTAPLQGPSQDDLKEALRKELVKQQDIIYGVIGGLAASVVGAIIWAAITVLTKHQIGYMAVGVGLLVGFTVRFFGAGIDKYFGVIGAFFALFGCLLGNLLGQVAFAAHEEYVGYFDVIGRLDLDVIIALFRETFSPMDVLFYAIAAYEGFRFSYRNLEDELVQAVFDGKVKQPRSLQLRLPIVIVLFVTLSILGYFVTTSSNGARRYNYESGAIMSAGQVVKEKEHGDWEYWYENGGLQAKGRWKNGKQVGPWTYYFEDGKVSMFGNMQDGLKDGDWVEYYQSGQVASKGQYVLGRQSGPWEFNYENGQQASKGNFWLDLNDGDWEYRNVDGHVTSKGKYEMGEQRGIWTVWFDNGNKKNEVEYFVEKYSKILNTWDEDGKAIIVNGNGSDKTFNDEGKVVEEGMIKDGLRFGTWTSYFGDGKKKEIGVYKDMKYYVKTAWNSNGEVIVSDGNGFNEYFYADGSRAEAGKIEQGLRTDIWKTYYPGSDSVATEYSYKNGNVEGMTKTFDATGFVTVEGMMVDQEREGPWKWYQAKDMVESEVTFVKGKKEGEQKFYNSYGDLLKTEIYKDGYLMETNVAK